MVEKTSKALSDGQAKVEREEIRKAIDETEAPTLVEVKKRQEVWSNRWRSDARPRG
jgi:hypothetical protein